MFASRMVCTRANCKKPARGSLPVCDDHLIGMFEADRAHTLALIDQSIRDNPYDTDAPRAAIEYAAFMDSLIAETRAMLDPDSSTYNPTDYEKIGSEFGTSGGRYAV